MAVVHAHLLQEVTHTIEVVLPEPTIEVVQEAIIGLIHLAIVPVPVVHILLVAVLLVEEVILPVIVVEAVVVEVLAVRPEVAVEDKKL